MKLLMITGKGGQALIQGKKGPFYYMLEEFSKYWERVDIICPKIPNFKVQMLNQIQNPNVKNFHGNVFVHSSPWPLWLQPWFILKKGLEIYKKEKFDLFTVHSYPSFYNDIGARWLWGKIKVPYVLEVMHISGYLKAADFKEWFYKILTRLFIRYSAKKAKAVRAINQKQTPGFLKKAGVEEKKIKYIPAFYIDFNVFKPQDIAKKYDLVFSGRLVKNKGINLLLKAVNNLKFKISNLKLIIVGTGPIENKLKKYVEKNNLQNNIVFAGWVPGVEDLAKAYNQSKIFVMPSLSEGGPRVTLEAMACKIPVITSKVGIMLDVIKDEENGLFIDWDMDDISKKIKLLLEDKNLYKKIAENGYKTVQQFERKKAIKNYALNYQKFIKS